MKKNYMFLVRGYPPNSSPSGNLIKPLVEELSKFNFVTIVSVGEKNETTKLNDNLTSIVLERKKQNKLSKKFKSILSRISWNYYDKSIFEIYSNFFDSLELNKFDSIFAVTFEEMIVLSKLENFYKKQKKIIMLEKFFYNNQLIKKKQNKLENNILKSVSQIYSLPVASKWLSEKYPEYDYIDIEHPMIVNKVSSTTYNKEKNRIIYGGGIDKKQRNPSEILEIFSLISKETDIEVFFYTYGNMQENLKNYENKNSYFHSFNAISLNEYNKELEKSNFLLSIGNRESDIVPSKLFDYISTGKPIIHFSYNDNDPYKNYLKRYRPSIIVPLYEKDLEMKKILQELLRFIETNKDGKNNMSFEEIIICLKECTPQHVAKIILNEESVFQNG